jgi:hypothetical protein
LKSGDFELKTGKKYLFPILPPLLQTNHAFNHSAVKTEPLCLEQLINRKILNYALTRKSIILMHKIALFHKAYKKITAHFHSKKAVFRRRY